MRQPTWMRSGFLKVLLVALSVAPASLALPVVYQATIDTSSIFGDAGSLDFNFNPGPLVTQAASLQIYGFSSDGTLLGAPQTAGDVSGGPLPSAAVLFDNGGGLNDYFDGFTFGNTLTFAVSLTGPALSTPDGVSTSGSTFTFSMFSDPGGSTPVLTSDPNGAAFTIAVNLDGTATPAVNSTQTSLAAIPEPSTFLLFGLTLLLSASCLPGVCLSNTAKRQPLTLASHPPLDNLQRL